HARRRTVATDEDRRLFISFANHDCEPPRSCSRGHWNRSSMVNDRACDAESRIVYKILTRADWEEALRAGRYAGSQDDVRDGFIHLSAPSQVAGTAARHFRGIRSEERRVGKEWRAWGPPDRC